MRLLDGFKSLETSAGTNGPLSVDVSSSDNDFIDVTSGVDEAGFRSRGRDLNSGPERGKLLIN